MTEWITDRQPTKEDEDRFGEVLMRRFPDGRDSSSGLPDALVAAAHVGPGVPWRHTAIWEPPATPEPQPEAPKPAPKPELRVGQVWRTRLGEVVTIKSYYPDPYFPFHGTNNERYTLDGRFHYPGTDRRDLVELITDTPAEAPQPQPEPEAPKPESKPELRVGQVWWSGEGEMVTIKNHFHDHYFQFQGSNGRRYTSRGRYCNTGKHVRDLVELITDAPAEAPQSQPQSQSQPEPAPTTRKVPRLFAGPIRRALAEGGGIVMDGLADDGTCWEKRPGDLEWRQVPPLPDREEPIDA